MVTNNDLTTIGGRIAEAIKHSRQSQRQIALAIGISPQALNKWPRTGNASKEALYKFCEVTDVSYDWLLNGNGSMKLPKGLLARIAAMQDSSEAELDAYIGAKDINEIDNLKIAEIEKRFGVKRDPNLFETESEKPKTPEFVDIPYYQEAELSLGNGAIIHDDEHPGRSLSFQQEWLDGLGLEVEHLVVVKCKGDSMEPRVRNGDIVLINKDIEAIEDGAIYALNYAGDAKLKRLITRADGSLIIRSDNQNGMFPDDTITESEADQLKIIGKAVWVGGML